MSTKSKPNTKVPADKACLELLSRTAAKSNISVSTLTNLCVESFIGSLETYGMTAPKTEMKAIKGSGDNGVFVTLSNRNFTELNNVAIYLGASMAAMVRDAVLGQRFNFQRLQPVNARAMPSVRKTLFMMEQEGPRQSPAA
jgi:hypothetical protein